MNEIIEKEKIIIKDMIYEIKGKQVIFDSDIALLYEVETKRINEAVKRNPLKFPERFCFKVSEDEYNNLKSQLATSSTENNYGGSRKGHMAFTEQGIAMLATILKSKKAIEVSIRVMDTFVLMRKYIVYNTNKLNLIEDKLLLHDKMFIEYDDKLDKLFNELEPKFKNRIFFKGETYDAYSLLLDILKEAKEEIIIIDNYADKKILDLISKTNKKVILVSKNINEELIKKYQNQYDNLTIKYKDDIHDRFIIIDRKILYHLGCSLKDLGSKCFGISKIEDKNCLNSIIKQIE